VTQGMTQSLTEMGTSGIYCGVKAAGAYGRHPYLLHVSKVQKFWEPKPCVVSPGL